MIKLPIHLKQMGESATSGHRSGWPFVIQALKSYTSTDGILLDDFVERTFQQTIAPKAWAEPWIGVFHHPPHLPAWFDHSAVLDHIIDTLPFQKSIPHLKGAIALSQYLADWLECRFDIPTIALKHPTEIPDLQWNVEKFMSNLGLNVVQVGWYLRNYRAIYQLKVPHGFRKMHLLQNEPWVLEAAKRTDQHSPFKHRVEFGQTQVVHRLENSQYDELLCRSVVFLELFDTSANNAVIESIVRNVPIIVNRHPATEEYLGADYPLFYDGIDQVHDLLDFDTIVNAHEYLKAMDKTEYSNQIFSDKLLKFVEKVR
jgi:hypothetical protein